MNSTKSLGVDLPTQPYNLPFLQQKKNLFKPKKTPNTNHHKLHLFQPSPPPQKKTFDSPSTSPPLSGLSPTAAIHKDQVTIRERLTEGARKLRLLRGRWAFVGECLEGQNSEDALKRFGIGNMEEHIIINLINNI